MATVTGSWSLSTTGNVTTASFTPENSSTATIKISGFSSSVTQENLPSVITVDDGGTISLKSGALSGLADGASLTLGEGYPQYSLKLDSSNSTIADKPKIDTTDNTPFTVTATSGNANNATLKGKLTAYYEPSEDGKTITFHDAADTTLATITGLTSVDSIAFDSATKTNIQLKLANLSNSKTGVSISPVTISNLDTTNENLNPANFKFTFVANGTEGDNDNTTGTNTDGQSTLGFTANGNTFKTVSGDNKAVTYNAKTMEGWTLSTDGKSITYTAADETKVLATITGLGYEVDSVTDSGVNVKNNGSKAGISVASTTITINKAALGSDTIELTNAEGSSYTLAFASGDTITATGNYNGKVGFDNYDTSTKYWQATDGTATYKYTIGEGWELDGTTKITHSGASTTELITLTGLKVNDITNTTTTAITGVNFGVAGASTSIDTSTIYISSGVFDTTTEGSVVSLTKSGTVGSNTYSKLALDASETTLKTALTVNTDPDLKLSTTITAGNATITGDTFEWYEIPTGGTPTTITYHKAKDDTAFATITGLASTASTGNVSFSKENKTLTLDAAALGTNTITLTTTTGISGLGTGDGNIDFKLALGDLGTTKAAAANQVDTNDNTKSITVSNGTATITGKTLPYYTVATGDKSITYSPAQTGQTLATISGLSSDANTSNVTFKMDGTTQTGTIVLGKAALGNSRITLVNGSVGNVAALGLKLAFDESDSTYNATNKTLGFEDSGDYWKVNNGKATYQHNTKEGWTLGTGNVVITYKDDGAAEEWLSLDNLNITSPSGTLVTGETEKYSSLNGITIDRNTGTLVISSDLLQADASKTVTLPTGYTVQIKEGANGTAGSSVGFGTHEDSPYWRVDGTTAYLQYDTDGGWKVENGKITYTAAKTGTTGTVLATITGLKNDSNSLTSTNATAHQYPSGTTVTNCYDTLNGVTFNKTTGVITIDSNALTTTNNAKAELTLGTGVAAGTYKLALGTGTDITGVENKIGFNLNSTTATVLEKRDAGYVLGDSDTTLTYKAAVNNTLATITGLASGVKYQTGDSDATLPKALYVDATGGNFTEVVTLDTTNKTVTLKENALSKTTGDAGTVKISETNSEYKLAIDGATNNKLGFDNEDGTTKSWHHVDVVASDSTPASTTAKYQYTVGEGWTLADGKTITYKAATTADGSNDTAPTVLVQITGLKASLTDTDLAAIGAPTLDSTTGFYTVTLPTSVLPENTNQVASSENNYILAIDGATNGEYGFGNSGGYWELNKVSDDGNYKDTITATYKCDYYKGWKVEDGKIKYTAETTKELAKIEGLNGGFMTIEAGKKYPAIAGITVDGDTFKLKQDVLGTSASAPVKVTKLTGADSSTSYKLAFADETNTDGSLGFVDSTPTWSIDASTNTTAHYTYKTGQGWKLESNGTISYTAETAAKTRAIVTGLKNDGNLLTNIKAGGITVSTDSPSAEQPGVLTLKKSVLNETNSQAVTVSVDDYTLAVDAGNTIDSATHTTALNFDAAASGTVTVKETLGAGWLSSNNDKTLTYYSAVDKELATITGLKAGVTASDFTFDATGKKVSVAASALTDKDVTIAKGSGETQSALQYTLALKDSTVTHDSKPAFGFANEDGAEKYFAVDGTTSTTVNYQHNVGEGWYLDGTQIKYVKPQQPTPENGDPTKYASPVVDVKITGLKSNLTDAEIAAGIKVGADGKTITVSKDVLGTTTTTLTDNSQSTYTLALKDAVDNTVGFADGSAYWKISGSAGNYTATYMYDTAEGWTINSDTITYTALTPKTVLTLTGLKTAAGTARQDANGDGIVGQYTTLNGIEVTADGKVKLSNSVLGNSNVTLAKVTDNDLNKLNATYKAATYSLALADDTGSANGNDDVTANDGKVGFVPKADKWVADSTAGTYKYQHEIGAGWSLSGTSKIVYTASSDDNTSDTINPVTLATVSNLKSGLTVNTNDGTIDGITVGDDGTITIATSILTTNASASTKLTLGKEDDNTTNLAAGTYKLAIAGDGEGDDVKDGKVGFAQSDPYLHAVSGTVTYQFDTDEGWTLNDAATEIAYSASKVAGGNDANKTKSTVLAKITGLSTGLNAVNGAIDGITVGSDGTFTIGSMNVFAQPASGATSTAVNLSTSAADGTYKLALGSDIATVAHVIDGSASTVTVSGGSATIKGTTEQYAKLNSDTSITYYAQQTDVPLATISGLKSDVNVGVSVAGGVITIDNRALNQTKVSLSIEDIADNEDFTFDLEDNGSNSVAQTANQLTGASSIGDIKNGVATIKQNTAAYYSVGQDGKSVNYNASASKTIAEITGLSSNATSSGVTLASRVITLGASALGKGTIALVNKKVGNVSDHGLSLKLGGDNGTGDDGTPANDNKFGFKEDTNGKWTIKDGVATYTLDTAEGWTLDTDANVIGYTPKTTAELAVVRGLKSGVKVKDDGSIDGITVTPPTSPSTTTTFSIAESLLGTAAVTLTDLDANDGKDFAFKLNDGTTTTLTSLGFTGNDGASAYWKIEDGTASYQYDVKEGWTVESDGSISYTAAETKPVFTVDGLKGIKNGTYSTAEQKTALQTAGLTLNSKAVELDTAVLGDNELTLTMGAGVSGYTLALADDTGSGSGNNDVTANDGQVGGVSVSAAWFLDSEGNAVYNKTKGATWRLGSGSTSILYTAAETYDQKPLVTIAGLKSGVTATDLNNYIGVSGSVVTLHKEILGTTEVTFTPSKDTNGAAKYTLALGGDVEGSTTTEYWTGKNGTLTLKQDASEGWSLSGTNTVKYTGKKTGATLATLTGLNKTLLPSNGGDPDTPAHVDGIAVSDSNILISDAALTTGNVSIKQGKDTTGTATNYSLVYNGSTSAGTAADANWLVAGGTATLKELTPAYYDVDNNIIKYHVPVAEKDDKRKDIVYAVVKGISKTATKEDIGVTDSYTTDSSGKITKGVITVKPDALNRTNITISGNYYTLATDDEISEPDVTKSAWTLNKTTATMKGDISAGYRASTDGKTIVYSKPQTNATLLTISGLPSTGISVQNNMIKVTQSDGTLTNAFTITNGNIVNMNANVLAKAPAKIVLKGTGYEFAALNANSYTADGAAYKNTNVYTAANAVVAGADTNNDGTLETQPGVDVWRVSGTKAVYKRVIPAHYKLTGTNTLVYVKETDYKDPTTKKAVTYATVTGLVKGLKVSEDGQTVLGTDGTTTAIDITSGAIDIKEAAVGTTAVTYTPGNTSTLVGTSTNVSLNETGTFFKTNETSDTTGAAWLAGGTTATLRSAITLPGWKRTTNSKTNAITFTKQATAKAASGSTVLATVTGLKKGMTAEADATVKGITVSGSTITLDNRVLPTTGTVKKTQVKLNNGKDQTYTLGIDTTGSYPVAQTGESVSNNVWSVSGTNVYYKPSTNATWELDKTTDGTVKNTLTLQSKETTTSGVTISGLKKGLKLNADGGIDGISLDGTTITLDSRVLGTGNVSVSGGYTLELASTGNYAVPASTVTGVWSVSNSKAVLKEVTSAGWTVKDGKVVYTKAATSSAKATIDGLKSGFKAVNGKIDGINDTGIYDATGKINSGSTIALSGTILDSKTVKISGSSNLTLKLAEADKTELASTANGGTTWTVSGTTAILKKANTAGYTVDAEGKATDNSGKTLTYNNGTTAGSTTVLSITGLKKGIKASNGEIAGITYKAAESPATGGTFTLDSRALGTTDAKLTTATGVTDDYALALQTDASKDYAVVDSAQGVKFTVENSGIITVSNGYTPVGYSLSGTDTIKYNKTASTSSTAANFATLSGLKSGLKANANGQIAGITYTEVTEGDNTTGTFTLSKDVLGTDTVTLTDKDSDANTTYKLALDGITSPQAATTGWAVNGNAAVLTITSEGGYTLGDSDTKVVYTPKGTSKVVVGGLSTINGLSENLATKTIRVSDSALSGLTEGKKVTVSDGYTLQLETPPASTAWVVSGNTASYVQTAAANKFLCDGNTITKVGNNGGSQVLATISGLPDNFDANNNATVANGVITLKDAAFANNTSDITLTGSGYTLAIASDATHGNKQAALTDAAWSVAEETVTKNKVKVTTATATLSKGTPSYYKPSADGKTLTYQPFATSGTATAKITGLKAGIKASAVDTATNSTTNIITLTKDMLGDSNVSLTGAGYKLALAADVLNKDNAGTEEVWTLKGTTLTINSTPDTYYTINDKGTAITTTVGTATKLATITGLAKDLTLNSSGTLDGVTIDETNKTIKLSQAVLGTGKTTLTANGYTLVMGNDVAEPRTEDYTWSIKGTTATLTANVSDGYTLTNTSKEKSIAYTAETKPVAATITGLKSGLTAADGSIEGIEFDGETITVSEDVLGTGTLTLTNKGTEQFKLALDATVADDTDADIINGEDVWDYDAKTFKATYKHVTPAHYKLSGNTITYVAQSAGTGIATLTGVSQFADEMFDETDKTVTIFANDVRGSDISISGDGYSLELDPQVSNPVVSEATWTQKSNTITLAGKREAGYSQTSDTLIKYSTADTKENFASIVGATGTFEKSDYVNLEQERVVLYKADLDENSVTVSGTFLLDFQGYENASINGTANAEKIAVDGTGLTVAAGGGNDYIDLGLQGGNTVVYGGGNDVIANFTATGNNQDTLIIDSKTVTKAIYDDGDALLTLNDGSKITLKDFGADTITYLDKNKVATTKSIEAADLMTSDNFIGMEDDLGAITSSGALGDLTDTQAFSGSDDLTTLTKQSTPVTFGGNKK